MKCEIEFLPVGKASKAGDAIIVRYGEPHAFDLMLIDGGTAETGEQLVDHLRATFGKSVVLSHVVLTHADADHVSGLRKVLEEITVEKLWLHVPWLLAPEAIHLFSDTRWTAEGLSKKIKQEYDLVAELFDIASASRVAMFYPFQGQQIGPFTVMSPTRSNYLYLLPKFEKTPEPAIVAIDSASMWIEKSTFLSRIIEEAKAKIQSWTKETWSNEKLKEGGKTSASNESSVVLYGQFESGNVLLTGDAGLMALNWAAEYADFNSLPLQQFYFVQIPHHGSRRNVGPAILNRLLGPVKAENSSPTFSAYVSAPVDDERFPRKMVTNAFRRRGGKIIATQGVNKINRGGFPTRSGYGDVTPLPFYSEVEDYT